MILSANKNGLLESQFVFMAFCYCIGGQANIDHLGSFRSGCYTNIYICMLAKMPREENVRAPPTSRGALLVN